MLAGLICRNAILIMESTWELELQGRTTAEAAIEACCLHLRPILITSIAFVIGVVPLVVSTGTDTGMCHAIDVAVSTGMLGMTLFDLSLTPMFYVLLRTLVVCHG